MSPPRRPVRRPEAPHPLVQRDLRRPAERRRVRRWSNQCAVESCSARNRVIGGSPCPGNSGQTSSVTAPAARASPAGTPIRGGGTPAARADRREELGDRSRFAVGHDEGPAGQRRRPVERRDERVDGVVEVGGVDQRGAGADEREAARPGRARRCARPAACRPVPRRGAGGRRRPRGPAQRARAARRGPCCARSDRGRGRGRPGPRRHPPARPRRGRPTATTRAPRGRRPRLGPRTAPRCVPSTFTRA